MQPRLNNVVIPELIRLPASGGRSPKATVAISIVVA